MQEPLIALVRRACRAHGHDRTRLLDIARTVQQAEGRVSPEAMDLLAGELGIPRVEVQALVGFYAFLGEQPRGRIVVRLCDDVVDRMFGYERVRAAFEAELGVPLGGTTPDGRITLERTACIGMSDQAPAALVNDVVVRRLSPDRAREIARDLLAHGDAHRLVDLLGDGNNAHELVQATVHNNLRRAGPVLFSPVNRGEGIRKALSVSPAEVIRAVKTARLRGRGGAGFPTGMKWEFTRAAEGARKFLVCNADEGEPGTFKDRVLLTEMPDRLFAGMTIAGYAIGAGEGIVYLRAEYAYLLPFLESVLAQRRADGLLGADVGGRGKYAFDISIRLGAGAYVCGEETALIRSLEGARGDPKNRPPFPAQSGYLGCPTCVNNVETLCNVTKILEEGPASYCEHGTPQSSGTKLLSISGDCRRPGVYEVEFGTPLREVLHFAGADDAAAVQVGGPSGRLAGPEDYDRRICFDDLATGGALIVFGAERDLLAAMHGFLEFFEEESCGHCAPCRVGTTLLRRGLERIRAGRADADDLARMVSVAEVMRKTSRCGLGQTAGNPLQTSLDRFRPVYEARLAEAPGRRRAGFDLAAAVAPAEALAGRRSAQAEPAPGGER